MVPELVYQARGVVLELGPGSGNQLSRYDQSKVSKIYGIEPNADLHEALRLSIKKAELGNVYTIIPHGAEEVERFDAFRIALNSVDTILCTQVLCSVPDPAKIVRHLYPYLKPGGKIIVYEHTQSKNNITRLVQSEIFSNLYPYMSLVA